MVFSNGIWGIVVYCILLCLSKGNCTSLKPNPCNLSYYGELEINTAVCLVGVGLHFLIIHV